MNTLLNGVGGPLALASSETLGSKCQRRSNIHLGNLSGDQPYDSPATASAKSSKIRVLTNLSTDVNANKETRDNKREANNNNINVDEAAIGSRRVKDSKKRDPSTKRVQSNWVSKFDDSSSGNLIINGNNNT
ncbi:hypothetical protein GQ457_11G020760 [Hibiscus cannabinus]